MYSLSKAAFIYIIIQIHVLNCYTSLKFQYFEFLILFEASRGAAARDVTVKPTACGFDLHSRRWNIYLNLYFHFFGLVSRLSAALSSATQHSMPPEFGRKRGTECLNTGFPLPTLTVCRIQREADLISRNFNIYINIEKNVFINVEIICTRITRIQGHISPDTTDQNNYYYYCRIE